MSAEIEEAEVAEVHQAVHVDGDRVFLEDVALQTRSIPIQHCRRLLVPDEGHVVGMVSCVALYVEVLADELDVCLDIAMNICFYVFQRFTLNCWIAPEVFDCLGALLD